MIEDKEKNQIKDKIQDGSSLSSDSDYPDGSKSAKSKDIVSSILGFFDSKHVKLASLAIAIIAALTGGVLKFDDLSKIIERYLDRFEYIRSLQHPIPSEIPDTEVKILTSGEVFIKLMQIDGYLGLLKNDAPWKRLCVSTATNKAGERNLHVVNTKYILSESRIDQVNRTKLEKRLSDIEISGDEEASILRIQDPFMRLLQRASRQLLFRQKSRDLENIEKPQLYLLRNSIYGQHGRPFGTAKLHKFMERRGWRGRLDYKAASLVEECNALYLEEIYPKRELGALGRGVLIKSGPSIPRSFKAKICACLSEPKFGIDCHGDTGDSYANQFRDFVDLIVDIGSAETASLTWTYLNTTGVIDEALPQFKTYTDTFISASVDFSAQLQHYLMSKDVQLRTTLDRPGGDHFGFVLNLPKKTFDKFTTDAELLHDTGSTLCSAMHSLLETTGPMIPWMKQ